MDGWISHRAILVLKLILVLVFILF